MTSFIDSWWRHTRNKLGRAGACPIKNELHTHPNGTGDNAGSIKLQAWIRTWTGDDIPETVDRITAQRWLASYAETRSTDMGHRSGQAKGTMALRLERRSSSNALSPLAFGMRKGSSAPIQMISTGSFSIHGAAFGPWTRIRAVPAQRSCSTTWIGARKYVSIGAQPKPSAYCLPNPPLLKLGARPGQHPIRSLPRWASLRSTPHWTRLLRDWGTGIYGHTGARPRYRPFGLDP